MSVLKVEWEANNSNCNACNHTSIIVGKPSNARCQLSGVGEELLNEARSSEEKASMLM
jgi:hypothetical protein